MGDSSLWPSPAFAPVVFFPAVAAVPLLPAQAVVLEAAAAAAATAATGGGGTLLAIFLLSLMEFVGVATAAAADVDADGESLLVLLTSWTTLDEALRCLSPLILTISFFFKSLSRQTFFSSFVVTRPFYVRSRLLLLLLFRLSNVIDINVLLSDQQMEFVFFYMNLLSSRRAESTASAPNNVRQPPPRPTLNEGGGGAKEKKEKEKKFHSGRVLISLSLSV